MLDTQEIIVKNYLKRVHETLQRLVEPKQYTIRMLTEMLTEMFSLMVTRSVFFIRERRWSIRF